jgi:7,8-dihydro-6-hydroxymethylpterin dimethyltransferase
MKLLPVVPAVPDVPAEVVLRETTSRCPVCRKDKPAQVIKVVRDGREQVIMRRTCPCHGTHEFTLASDARFYYVQQGEPAQGCCGPAGCGGKSGTLGTNATDPVRVGDLEQLSTCLALIEIVDSCNLTCPTCYADSPVGHKDGEIKSHSFEELTGRVQGVIDRKGKIEILQLTGGEPTLHPEFFRILRWACANPLIDVVLINTNGVKFATESLFVKEISRVMKDFKVGDKPPKLQLYLQFDGVQHAGQKMLRGADFRGLRERAIKNCKKIGLPITLAMTVIPENFRNLWDSVEFGLKFNNVRGISFQPVFLSGRRTPLAQPLPQPITVSDIILELNIQSRNQVRFDDLTPLPCGDPNCHTIGWIVRAGGKLFSPSALGIDVVKLQALLKDRVNYTIEDLKRCGCETSELGVLIKAMEKRVSASNAFRIFIKPFMDERTWDKDRVDRCCTHVIDTEGRLRSFCEYYYGPYNLASCAPEAVC